MDWYYAIKGERKGPVDDDFIKNLLRTNVLSQSDYVWNQAMGEKWSRIGEVPALFVLPTQPAIKQSDQPTVNFDQVFKLQAREKRARRIITLTVVAIIALSGYAGYYWVKNKPFRRCGIDSKNPIGQFAALDNFFAVENLMDKAKTDKCDLTSFRSAQMYSYTNPKAERGAFVSGAGVLTLLADETGNLKGIHAMFPSSGPREGAIVNECVLGIFAKEYWQLLGNTNNVKIDPISTITPEVTQSFALTTLPPKSNFGFITRGNARGFWFEYGPGGRSTMVMFRVAEN